MARSRAGFLSRRQGELMRNRTVGMRLIAVLVATAAIAAACAGDSDGVDPSTDAEVTYFEALQRINQQDGEEIDSAFEAAFAQAEGETFEAILPDLSEALTVAIATQRSSVDEMQQLNPPDRFTADHDRAIEFLESQIDAWERQLAATASRETELVVQVNLEIEGMRREAFVDLSSEFAERSGLEAQGLRAADVFGDLNDDEATYLDAVAAGFDEFGRRNRVFGRTITQSYVNDDLLLQALLDAGAGEAFAAARDAIVLIDPPVSYAEGHQQLVAYLDGAVALDLEVAAAAERRDVVGFEVANFHLSLLGAGFALEGPPALAGIIGDPAGLVPPEELPGGAYGSDLWEVLQRFRILALRQELTTGVFPVISDENLAAAMAQTYPTIIELTEEAARALGALDAPAEFGVGHEILATYFEELIALRQSVLDAASLGDIDTLKSYGELGGFAADRTETELWCTARAGITGDAMEPITETFFTAFAVATVEQLCGEG